MKKKLYQSRIAAIEWTSPSPTKAFAFPHSLVCIHTYRVSLSSLDLNPFPAVGSYVRFWNSKNQTAGPAFDPIIYKFHLWQLVFM